ncbi:MAG TPA: GGDEF domain-containing protein [Bryobacteraceae bacterium]|nr:GGDEF domain-containing protein [Bryobacteraceae bacterium]
MSGNVESPVAGNRRAGERSPSREYNDSASIKTSRRIVVMGGQNQRSRAQESPDEGLTSALLAQDKALTQILEEVDSISKDLKSSSQDTQALSNALQRTVLCALKQSILDRELRSLALTDDLTSLYNRRAFYALANQQLKVARRKGNGLLLFFADVDHLKNINDTYGHLEGDLALVRAADALEQTFRDSDILARLSGDEFAVLALEASSEDQDAILRRLKRQIQLVGAEETRYQLSLSVGMVRFDPKQDASLGDLLSKADRAMYAEKRSHPPHWARSS